MLIQFSVQNYRSFREEQTLSLVAGKDGAHSDSLINCGGKFQLSKVASIYGANASGKSNLMKAMKAMERFVLDSATRMSLGDSIEFVSPFRLDTSTVQEPSRFEITLLIEGDIFVYGFSATKERVHDEWLSVQPQGKRSSKWLQRSRDKDSGTTSWAFRGPLKKDADLLKEKTRDNGLLLSRAAELNIEDVKPLYLWFRQMFQIFDLSYPPRSLGRSTAKRISEDKEFQNRVIRFIREADFGINSLSVEEEAMPNIPDDAPEELRELHKVVVNLQKLVGNDEKVFSVTTEHSLNGGEDKTYFSLEGDESNGTQRFFALAGPILSALSDRNLLVIDELDCSMHPLLTRKVIELFQSPEENTNGAQLVFATHDSSVMDQTLLRRDQIWLTEKQANGATELFSLYDFGADSRPRKGTAFEKNYLAGRYGAVPSFGPFFEDL